MKIHIPNEINNNPLYRGCLTFPYELFFIRLDPFIGYGSGVKGHHVFINSVLGLYMDHFKGNRKDTGTSSKKDFRPQSRAETKDITQLDYWKKIKN